MYLKQAQIVRSLMMVITPKHVEDFNKCIICK